MRYDQILRPEDKQIQEMIPKGKIAEAVHSVGMRIRADYIDRENGLVMICVLKGAAPFFTDLIRELYDIPLTTEYIFASSYHGGTVSSGAVDVQLTLTQGLRGKDVIIVEDIIDTGRSIHDLVSLLKEQEPASITVAAFLHKASCQDGTISAKVYSCFEADDRFVVGYGMDWKELFRNTPCVYALTEKN